MATDDKSSDQKPGKGFAGLSSMVSDVDAALEATRASATRASSATHAATSSPPSRRSQESEPYQAATSAPSSAGESSGWKWVLGIAGMLGAIWFYSETTNKPPSSSTTSYVEPTPAPAAPLPSRGFQAAPSTPSRIAEEMPPVGTGNVLSVPQIRYCLAEDIRIEGSKGVLNKYDNDAIDRFNGTVEDYNSRCGSFRYRRGALESARSDVESIRSTLQREGEARFTSQPSVRPLTDREVFDPDPTTLAIQQHLNELGFDAGSPDGVMGPRTRSAIAAYQRSVGLEADGQASAALLERVTATPPAFVEAGTRPNSAAAVPEVQFERSPTRSAPSQTPTPEPVESASSPPTQHRRLSQAEQDSLESSCSSAKYVQGPAAYNACKATKLDELQRQGPAPDLSRLSTALRDSIESACSSAKYVKGPAPYNACLTTQVRELERQSAGPDLSSLNTAERDSIESACSSAKYVRGAAAYVACLTTKFRELQQQGSRPDMSRLSRAESDSIESACSSAKYVNGPAAYNACLSRNLQALERQGPRPNLTQLSNADRDSIESACASDKYVNGPAAYNACLSRQLAQLRR